jgi:mannose-1-phosphate guanylyltransferase
MEKTKGNKKGKTPSLYAVILAGGKGERFWPRSRKDLPKQLLNLSDAKTMVESTIERITPFVRTDHIFLVARHSIKQNLNALKLPIPKGNFLFEPHGRNTAPALCLAAFTIACIDPESIMIVLPADHFIRDKKAFLRCIQKAIAAAKHDFLVTFGIVPTRPETGFGYIECGECISEDVCVVKRFKEKPSQKKANEFIKSGRFLWNSGIFVWKTKRIIEAFHTHQPDLAKKMEACCTARNKTERNRLLLRAYDKAESISIDYAVMEKASNVAMVRASFGWDDVGAWNALERILEANEDGNVLVGNVVSVDMKDSIVVSDGGVIGVIGVKNLVVVHTEDATLIIPKERAQEVRDIVRQLQSKKKLEKFT